MGVSGMTKEMYDWTRFEADYTSKVKAQAYDANIVAMKAMRCFELKCIDYKEAPGYTDARETFLDLTMSCDREEAANWMNYWMSNAIAYGIQTKKMDWKTKFLAAYDLFEEIVHWWSV